MQDGHVYAARWLAALSTGQHWALLQPTVDSQQKRGDALWPKTLCSLLSSSGAKHLPRCSHLSHLKTASCLQISPEAKVAWACLHPEQFFESSSYHLMLEIQHSIGVIILIGSLVMNSSLTIARISFHVPRVWEVYYSIHNWPLCSHRALQ